MINAPPNRRSRRHNAHQSSYTTVFAHAGQTASTIDEMNTADPAGQANCGGANSAGTT